MFKEEDRVVIEGSQELFKSELQDVLDNYDYAGSQESFVGFHIIRGEQGQQVRVICNLNPKDMITLHRAFNGAMRGYLETIAEKSPMTAAKIMAQMMLLQDDNDDDDTCTCGHCNED